MKLPKFIVIVNKARKECSRGYKEGDQFEFSDYTTPPQNLCTEAIHALFPVIYAFSLGANFPFAEEENTMYTTCPEEGRVTFKVVKVLEKKD